MSDNDKNRIKIKLPAVSYDIVKLAATLTGTSVKSFAAQAVINAALHVTAEIENRSLGSNIEADIHLTEEEAQALLALVESLDTHDGKDEDQAFCSGGDQKVRGNGGYVGEDNIPRLNVLDLQRLIRVVPKPVIAMVNGYAVGGGHVLHILCDLSIAAETAKFGQTGPRVGSFDGGYGASYLAAIVGQKKAREIWSLGRLYTAAEALDMGLVNKVVPFDELEAECVSWAREMLQLSPTALRFLKASFNAATDGYAGLQQLAGDATLLYYTSDEAKEGRDAFKEKRKPDFDKFPKFP